MALLNRAISQNSMLGGPSVQKSTLRRPSFKRSCNTGPCTDAWESLGVSVSPPPPPRDYAALTHPHTPLSFNYQLSISSSPLAYSSLLTSDSRICFSPRLESLPELASVTQNCAARRETDVGEQGQPRDSNGIVCRLPPCQPLSDYFKVWVIH